MKAQTRPAGFDAMAGPNESEVRQHYATLAKTYTAKANRACNATYIALAREHLAKCNRILEVGAGTAMLLQTVDAPVRVAVDYSVPMLRHAVAPPWIPRIGADGARLPFRDGSFDGVFAINVLEHVPDTMALVEEVARVLTPGGVFVTVTPNGDVEWLLDLLERLRLKLPEGPHAFLNTRDLRDLVPEDCERVLHRRLLAFPAGPLPFVIFMDALAGGWGLFQMMVLRKRP